MSDPSPELIGVMTTATVALVGAVGALWKELNRTRENCQKEADQWREKWSQEVKERSRDSELFRRALSKQRDDSSLPPPSS